jgi:PAS domain S-box-containing protein
MTIGRKLTLCFLLVAILVGFVGYLGINYSKKVGEIFKFTREVEIPSLVSILQLKAAARQASIKAIEHSIRGDERDREKTEEALVKMDTHLDALKKAENREGIIDIAGSNEAASIKKIEHMVFMFKKELNEFITLKDKGASIDELFKKEIIIHNVRKDLIHLLYHQIDYQHEELNHAIEITNRYIKNGFRDIFLMSSAVVFLAIVMGFFAARSISIPIIKLKNAAAEYSRGSLDTRIDIKSEDEIGQLSDSFNKMADELKIHQKRLESLVEARTNELKTANEQLKNEIDERRLTEEALAAEKERLSVTLRSIGDGVIAADSEGRIILLNKVAEELTGWSHEEAVGNLFDDVCHLINENTRERCENPVDRVIKTGAIVELANHTILINKDRTERILADSAAPILDAKNSIIGVVLVFRDITETRRVEEQLRQSRKMKAIATLAGGVAHEFNNALSGISGNIELLQMKLPHDRNIDKYAERMKDSVHRMVNLTSQLLAYARGGKYKPSTLSLNDFIKSTLPVIRHNIKPIIRIETELSGDISNIEVDPVQMQMVLSAVLRNASESMDDSGCIRIITKNERIDEDIAKISSDLKPGDYACLIIEDEGKGIDNETALRVFDPFFTTKFHGRGLGMSAALGVIKNHGGSILIDSEPGKGTVVRIYLPAAGGQAEQIKDTEIKETKGTETILLIEDEDLVIDVIRPMLERLGYHILVARNGSEAIYIARTFDGDIDLAIMDIVLPDIEGDKLYPLIMEDRPNLKVIVCSGYALDGPAQAILDSGAQDFIQKPFSLKTLSEKLRKVLMETKLI